MARPEAYGVGGWGLHLLQRSPCSTADRSISYLLRRCDYTTTGVYRDHLASSQREGPAALGLPLRASCPRWSEPGEPHPGPAKRQLEAPQRMHATERCPRVRSAIQG